MSLWETLRGSEPARDSGLTGSNDAEPDSLIASLVAPAGGKYQIFGACCGMALSTGLPSLLRVTYTGSTLGSEATKELSSLML